MLILKRIKWLPIQYGLLSLIFMKYTYATIISLNTCTATDLPGEGCNPSANGVCISGNKFYKLTKADNNNSVEAACEEIAASTVYFFKVGKTDVESTYTNDLLLYVRGSGSSYIQITSDYYLANDYLFDCTSADGKCKGTAVESTKDGFYLDGSSVSTGSNPTYSKLISCSSASCNAVNSIRNGYYPEGPADNDGKYDHLIKCESGNKCKEATPTTEGGVYPIEDDASDSGYKKLLKYDGTDYAPVTPASGAVYLDAREMKSNNGDATKVIKCGKETTPVCKSEVGTTDPGKGYIDALSDATTATQFENVIVCSGSTTVKCSSKTNGNAQAAASPVAAQNTAFVNAASDSDTSKLIICTTTQCVKGSPAASAQGHAYLDGTKFSSGKFTNLITCPGGTCASLTTPPSVVDGQVYIDAGTDASGTYANIITCTKSGSAVSCVASTGSATGAAYIDATATSNIIDCNVAANGCVSSAAHATDDTANKFYVNGNTDTKIIICTKADGCSSQFGNTSKIVKYYPDSLDKEKIISCAINKGTCGGIANALSTTGYYVDGYTGGLLGCDQVEACKPVEEVITDELTAYINFDTKSVIQCTKEKSKRDGAAESIVCTTQSEVESSDTNKYYYINAADTSKIIECSDNSGTSSCTDTTAAVKSDDTTSAAYYNDGETKVIQCSDNEDGDTVCSTTGPTTSKPKVNYIEAVDKKDIITCSIENSKAKCVMTDNASTGKEPAYVDDGFAYIDYVNTGNIIKCDKSDKTCTSAPNDAIAADPDNDMPEQNACYMDGYDSTAKQTLIICTATEEGGSCKSEKLTSFTETYAFLDGSTSTGGTFIKLLKLKSTKEIEQIASPLSKTSGYAYIDGTDPDKKRIISCDSDCKVINNGSANETDDEDEINAFYIDGVVNTKIIICTPESGCESKDGNESGAEFDNYYPDSQNVDKILQCKKDGTSCTTISHAATATVESYYMDGYRKDYVLKCENGSICKEITGIATPGYGYIDSSATGNIIVCKNNNNLITCVSQDNGGSSGSPAQNSVFIDASKEDSKSMITCSATGTACSQVDISIDQGIAFLDGTSISNSKFTNLITCDIEADTCAALAASNKTPKTNEGYVYIDGTSNSSGYQSIIQCISNTSSITCAAEAPETSAEYGYIDATDENDPIKRIITCASGCESEENTSEAAEMEDGKVISAAVNKFYINGKTKTKIIVCTNEEGCSTFDGSKKLKEKKYYIDSSQTTNIIKCEGPASEGATAAACTSSSHAGTSNDAYYIDGYDTKNVLMCNTDGCVSTLSLATDNQPTHYVDAGGDSGKPVMITCTTNECTTGLGVTDPGTAYLDPTDNTKIIICESTQCKPPTDGIISGKSDTYIDAGDFSQIIYCGEDECKYFSTNPSTDHSEYFARLNDGIKELIECDFNSTSTKKSTCKLDKTEATKVNSVYINYLFGKEGGDSVNPLIICDSSKCTPSVATITGENKSYYINSDLKSVDKELNGDLIECTEESKECTILPGRNSEVYLNANYDSSTNNKQVIICKTENGCEEYKTDSSATDLRYYINSGSKTKKSLEDTLIECKDTCEIIPASDNDIYINEFDKSKTIQCFEDKGCISVDSKATDKKNEVFLNSSDIKADNEKPLEKDLIICVNNEGEIECAAQDGHEDDVYINSHNTTEIIYCTSDGCNSMPSEAEKDKPEYYINADSTDEDLLSGDLIKCKNSNGNINCEVFSGKDGDVYLNSIAENDNTKDPLIVCSESKGCITDPSKAASGSVPVYYVNSGTVSPSKLEEALIQCTYEDLAVCSVKSAKANDVYVNYADNSESHPIIKCTNNGCKSSVSASTKESKEYYLNAGDTDDMAFSYDIIECTNNDDKITCTEKQDTGVGVYLNSNYASSGDKNQLIKCSSDNGCTGIEISTDSKQAEYYVNAEAKDLINAIIFCSNNKCEKQSPPSVNTYYVGVGEDSEINGLIECVESSSSPTDNQVRRKRTSEKRCTLKSAFTSSGYYLNGGFDKLVNQTIICDSSDGCKTEKVDLGYYVNAGDVSKPIIKCEKEGTECVAEESKSCPNAKDAVPGNYCYEGNQLKFYPASNSTSVSASKSENYYTFASIPNNGFPGIKESVNTLFKVSQYYINRFYQSGVVMIDKNGKLVDNLLSDQSDINIYDCNDITKTCVERQGCVSNTYMFDTENNKAVFCNSGKMEYAEFTGYVLDGNRAVGSNYPYLIKCENNGKKCESVKPKNTSYFENSGYDSGTNNLIQCNNNNCMTVAADIGYYIGHEGNGVIHCTSSTSCTYTKSKYKVKYVNAGFNKNSYAIISCIKNNGCSAVKANVGYYLTYSNSLLIQCTDSSSCSEFTPTVNYYDNADSSESNNTIINCTQNSQEVTCALEATNNGFYMSSSPNVLIRCKAGSKCKTVTVKNGIFRGAIKGLLGGSKRSDDVNIEEKDLRDNVEETPLEEDGASVSLPRDSDDGYGIIRCIAGKCSALSSSEIAAIPICEFNNNKCYITLEYAMTKSATTSIATGNICTNGDRSVFYFATDTIVVKPNVISGVTATYVYTTTNSNCLEVNDSYTDNYFTVGSNIYLLDQGSVLQFYDSGYYFINTSKNTLVNGSDIDAYNDENVKLYKCNGSSCSIVDKPQSTTYYADVNKRIIKYNVNSDSYSFAYTKDITCIFANNKCTPNADLKNKEFCITYKGELALVKADIKNRETGECYKASNINSSIYGYSQYLYKMNLNSAEMVDETGYYIISLSTNTTVVSKNYRTKNNNLVVYGCQHASCKEYKPDEDTYYYDAQAKNILRYVDGVWKSPSNSGYANISIDPSNTYIYRFTKTIDEIKINSIANYGYYYTVDGEMYHCDRDEDGQCSQIDNSGYYFTNAGEVYYCVHDSEELEPTECTKQACISGQYYFIDDAYYRCESSSTLLPVMSRYCNYNENVVVNFPLALTEEYPDKIKQAIDGIERNNNSTAIATKRGKNYLESVSGIFTNCTYNVEETKSNFDLVCVNNFVSVDETTDDVKICSIEQLGYVECVEDENNPEKCNVSSSHTRISLSIFCVVVATMLSVLLNYLN